MVQKSYPRRDAEALERLRQAAAKAPEHLRGRVAADLSAEADLAEADAQELAASGDQTGADTARFIAASIARLHLVLTQAHDTEGDEQ